MKKKITLIMIVLFLIVTSYVFFQNKAEAKDEYKDINISEFQNKINKQGDFSIYIYSTSCATCKEFKRTLNSVIKEENANVIALDVSNNSNKDMVFLKKQNLVVTPTLVVYKDGAENKRIEGNIPHKELKEFLK
ncbi:MAG: thioredoxin family protein [Bacillota bacterium]|uniref:Thioredoxin family protein n=1 Tax=Peribacillus simplex TaxID=1478 RepID=A0A9X8ZG81_9BACI|nr:thioredoxin family protein [Peribacillus simplex]TKH10677.1 thioredoxin family protein [Peribacillus simplex]